MSIRLKLSLSAASYALVCLHCLRHHGHPGALPRTQAPRVVHAAAPVRAAPRAAPAVDASAARADMAARVAAAPAAPADAAVAPEPARAVAEDPQAPATTVALQAAVDAVMARHAIVFVAHGDTIDPRSHRQLDDIASLFRRAPTARFEVQGHTDNVGDPEANRDMSARRAASVARYLGHNGISLRRMRVMGFGDTRPVAENTTSEGRLRNRRVSFRVLRGP